MAAGTGAEEFSSGKFWMGAGGGLWFRIVRDFPIGIIAKRIVVVRKRDSDAG